MEGIGTEMEHESVGRTGVESCWRVGKVGPGTETVPVPEEVEKSCEGVGRCEWRGLRSVHLGLGHVVGQQGSEC